MSLLGRRLLVVSGKGGTGRSTIAAALALTASSRGKRVLVCEVNTRERIPALLGVRPGGPEVATIAPGIDHVVVRPREAMREYALLQLRFRALYTAVFENRFVSRFLRFIPSLAELVMLGKVLHHVRQGRWDVVILDGPATGHGIAFLRVPQVMLDTVPPGPLRNDVRWMHELLVDPAVTAVSFVALPEELPANETVELWRATRDVLHMAGGLVFLNRCFEPRFTDGEREVLAAPHVDPYLEASARAALSHGIRADRTELYRERLRREVPLPLVSIPFLPPEGDFGRPDVERVARAIEPAVAP
jgi:hypothetical protein